MSLILIITRKYIWHLRGGDRNYSFPLSHWYFFLNHQVLAVLPLFQSQAIDMNFTVRNGEWFSEVQGDSINWTVNFYQEFTTMWKRWVATLSQKAERKIVYHEGRLLKQAWGNAAKCQRCFSKCWDFHVSSGFPLRSLTCYNCNIVIISQRQENVSDLCTLSPFTF